MKAVIDGNAICIQKDDFQDLQQCDTYFVTIPEGEDINETCELLNRLFSEDKLPLRKEPEETKLSSEQCQILRESMISDNPGAGGNEEG